MISDKKKSEKRKAESLSVDSAAVTWFPLIVLATSLAFWSSAFDVFNFPKQAILVTGSLVILFLHILSMWNRRLSPLDFYFIVILILIVSITALHPDWPFRLWWGMFGRANGALTYLGFIVVAAGFAIFFSRRLLSRLFLMALVSYLCQCLYGFLQFLGLDPIPWNNPHSPVITFFGNPNFSAASLGFLTVASLKFLKFRESGLLALIRTNSPFLILLCLSLFLNYQTRSIQGLVTVIAGVYLYLIIKVSKLQIKVVKRLWRVSLMALFPLPIIFGLLGIGPLGLIKQETILNRIEYWRVSLKILQDYPLIGVGPDGFGLFYGEYRSLAYTQKYGPGLYSSAAHNVILQWGTSFGLLGLLIYTSVMCLVVLSFIYLSKVVTKEEQTLLNISFVTWLTYQLTALISIEQIGVAIWGWAFSGVIIGWAFAKKSEFRLIDQKKSHKERTKSASSGLDGLVALVIVIALYPASSVVRGDVALRAAVTLPGASSGIEGSRLDERGTAIFESAKRFAGDRDYVRYSMISLFEQGPAQKGAELSQLGYDLERRNTQALEGLALMAYNENRWMDVVHFRREILKLDPFDYFNEARLGNAYYKMGDSDSALFHLSRANEFGRENQEMAQYQQLEKLILSERKS